MCFHTKGMLMLCRQGYVWQNHPEREKKKPSLRNLFKSRLSMIKPWKSASLISIATAAPLRKIPWKTDLFSSFLNTFAWYFWVILKYNWCCTRCKHTPCSNCFSIGWGGSSFSHLTHNGGSPGNSATRDSLGIPRKVSSTESEAQKYLQAARGHPVGKTLLRYISHVISILNHPFCKYCLRLSPKKESQDIHLLYHWIRSLETIKSWPQRNQEKNKKKNRTM